MRQNLLFFFSLSLQEPDPDISSEIKDMLNKTVLHSVPLVKPKNTDTILEKTDDFTRNFKKFRKVNQRS